MYGVSYSSILHLAPPTARSSLNRADRSRRVDRRLALRGVVSLFVAPFGGMVALSTTDAVARIRLTETIAWLNTVRHRLEGYGAEMRKSSTLSCSRRLQSHTMVGELTDGCHCWPGRTQCWNCQADSLRAFVHRAQNARERSAAAPTLDTDAVTAASLRSRPCGHSAGLVCGLDASQGTISRDVHQSSTSESRQQRHVPTTVR